MLDLEIRVLGWGQWQQRLATLVGFARHPISRDAALRIRDNFTEETTRAFATLGRSTGRAWPRLAPSTQAEKARHWPGRPLLVRTGRLANSLTNETDRQFLFQHRPTRLTLGSRDAKVATHQQGTRRMPERRVFELSPEIGLRWVKVLADDLAVQLEQIV